LYVYICNGWSLELGISTHEIFSSALTGLLIIH